MLELQSALVHSVPTSAGEVWSASLLSPLTLTGIVAAHHAVYFATTSLLQRASAQQRHALSDKERAHGRAPLRNSQDRRPRKRKTCTARAKRRVGVRSHARHVPNVGVETWACAQGQVRSGCMQHTTPLAGNSGPRGCFTSQLAPPNARMYHRDDHGLHTSPIDAATDAVACALAA